MIEINLLNEGHGILYKRITPWYTTVYFKFLLLIFLFLALFFILNRNKHYLYVVYIDIKSLARTEYIVKESGNDNKLNVNNVKLKKEIIKKEKFIEKEDERTVVANVTEHSLNILYDQIEKKSDILKKKENSKKKSNKINIFNKIEFKVIAGTCLYKSSADSISSKLKKNGYPDSVITESKISVNLYSVMLGDFYNLEDIDEIRKKINKKVEIEVVEFNEKFVVKTPSKLRSKTAELSLKYLRTLGIEGKILKTKEKKDGFVVVVKKFNNYKEAYLFSGKLKKKGITTSILKDILEL